MTGSEATPTGTRRVVVAGALIVAYTIAIAVWAVSPFTDHVPVGTIDGGTVSQPVSCNAIVDSPARDVGEPLPDPTVTFAEQLAGAQTATDLAYSRVPCEDPRDDGQLVLAINVVLVLLVTAAWVGWIVLRRRRNAADRDVAAVGAGTAG